MSKNQNLYNESPDNDNDQDQPSGGECLTRCKQFAEITGTDTALAMFYLQDTNWNLEKGLNAYYQSTKSTNSKVVACFDVEELDDDERRNNEKSKKSPDQIVTIESSDEETENESNDSIEVEDEQENSTEEKFFKILSWNIDGLDKSNLESRTLGVVKTILKENPDVIFLQEVISESEFIIKESLKKLYNLTSANTQSSPINYYTMILSKIKTCKHKNSKIIDFENSAMGRNLLQVKLNYRNKIDLCVMTAHLESTTDFAKQRLEQLQKCFDQMLEQDENTLVFFGGDLNLRDSELKAIGGIPNKIYDMWESTGSRKECLYTWDTMRNTNLKMNGKFKPRCRFDRLYYRPVLDNNNNSRIVVNKKPDYTLMPVYFELEGLERLKSCGRFSSDHWAIQSYCQIEPNKSV